VAWSDLATSDAVANLSFAPAPVLYATLGTLVVRRAGNAIGWMMLGLGCCLAIMALASVTGTLRLRAGHGGAARLRYGTRPDGVDSGRRDRRGPGRGLDPGRAELRPHATWPRGSTPPAAIPLIQGIEPAAFELATRAVAVRHGDELLGALTVQKPKNEPVSAAEDKLLTQLASQAGLVLRNVRLNAELQATIGDLRAPRRRLVRAQDEERQRIERNLHDRAQQHLVALIVQLSLLEDSAGDSDGVKQMTCQLRNGLRAALDDLRALASGIHPPLLAGQGLGPAL